MERIWGEARRGARLSRRPDVSLPRPGASGLKLLVKFTASNGAAPFGWVRLCLARNEFSRCRDEIS